MKKIRTIQILMLCAAIWLSACTKRPEIGPQGPVGEQGPPGEPGAKGPSGDPGASGTIKVITSDWLSFPFTGSGRNWTGTINAPEITQEVLDKGTVAVYYFLNNQFIYKLPYKGTYASTNWVKANVSLGTITIQSTTNLTVNTKFRYVITPPGNAGAQN